MWFLQMRYAAGTKDVLDRFFNNKPLKKDDVIVEVSRSPYLQQWQCHRLACVAWLARTVCACILLHVIAPISLRVVLWLVVCQIAACF